MNRVFCLLICALAWAGVLLGAKGVCQADMPIQVHAYGQAQAPCLEGSCFIKGHDHPPVVNGWGDVAFLSGLSCHYCNCRDVNRTTSAWLVNFWGAYALASSEELQGVEDACPLTDVAAPTTGTYDNQVLHLSDLGDVFFTGGEGLELGLWVVEPDCRVDDDCASGSCDFSGACRCSGDGECPSGLCDGEVCKLHAGPVYHNGMANPNGAGTFTFTAQNPTRVNAQGVVVFRASIRDDSKQTVGLFRKRPGEPIEQLALAGDPAPDLAGYTFKSFWGFAVADDPQGTVVFAAMVEDAAGFNDRVGLWSDRQGYLAALATPTLDPEHPDGSIREIDQYVLEIDDQLRVFFGAQIWGSPDWRGLFMLTSAVDGVVDTTELVQLTDSEHRALLAVDHMADGQAAYLHQVEISAVQSTRLVVGGLDVARSGDPDPDDLDPAPQKMSNFRSLAANRAGQAAFLADLRSPCSTFDQAVCEANPHCTWNNTCIQGDPAQGLFLYDPAEGLMRVVRTGSAVELDDGQSDTVTGLHLGIAGATANVPLDVSPLNDQGQLCFYLELAGPAEFAMACTGGPKGALELSTEASLQPGTSWASIHSGERGADYTFAATLASLHDRVPTWQVTATFEQPVELIAVRMPAEGGDDYACTWEETTAGLVTSVTCGRTDTLVAPLEPENPASMAIDVALAPSGYSGQILRVVYSATGVAESGEELRAKPEKDVVEALVSDLALNVEGKPPRTYSFTNHGPDALEGPILVGFSNEFISGCRILVDEEYPCKVPEEGEVLVGTTCTFDAGLAPGERLDVPPLTVKCDNDRRDGRFDVFVYSGDARYRDPDEGNNLREASLAPNKSGCSVSSDSFGSAVSGRVPWALVLALIPFSVMLVLRSRRRR